MADGNAEPQDYYLLPRLDMRDAVMRLCDYNGLSLDAYLLDTLDHLYRMTVRLPLRLAA